MKAATQRIGPACSEAWARRQQEECKRRMGPWALPALKAPQLPTLLRPPSSPLARLRGKVALA